MCLFISFCSFLKLRDYRCCIRCSSMSQNTVSLLPLTVLISPVLDKSVLNLVGFWCWGVLDTSALNSCYITSFCNRVHIITWNVGSATPPDDITTLLGLNVGDGNTDMYIIGWVVCDALVFPSRNRCVHLLLVSFCHSPLSSNGDNSTN